MKNKHEVLVALLEYKFSWMTLSRELDELGGMNSGTTVRILPSHIASVLNRFVNNELSALDVEEWANIIEMREEVVYGQENEQQLKEVVWELANPSLSAPLTIDRARELISALRR